MKSVFLCVRVCVCLYFIYSASSFNSISKWNLCDVDDDDDDDDAGGDGGGGVVVVYKKIVLWINGLLLCQ